MPRLTTPGGQKLLSATHYLVVRKVVRKACVCQYNDSLNIPLAPDHSSTGLHLECSGWGGGVTGEQGVPSPDLP